MDLSEATAKRSGRPGSAPEAAAALPVGTAPAEPDTARAPGSRQGPSDASGPLPRRDDAVEEEKKRARLPGELMLKVFDLLIPELPLDASDRGIVLSKACDFQTAGRLLRSNRTCYNLLLPSFMRTVWAGFVRRPKMGLLQGWTSALARGERATDHFLDNEEKFALVRRLEACLGNAGDLRLVLACSNLERLRLVLERGTLPVQLTRIPSAASLRYVHIAVPRSAADIQLPAQPELLLPNLRRLVMSGYLRHVMDWFVSHGPALEGIELRFTDEGARAQSDTQLPSGAALSKVDRLRVDFPDDSAAPLISAFSSAGDAACMPVFRPARVLVRSARRWSVDDPDLPPLENLTDGDDLEALWGAIAGIRGVRELYLDTAETALFVLGLPPSLELLHGRMLRLSGRTRRVRRAVAEVVRVAVFSVASWDRGWRVRDEAGWDRELAFWRSRSDREIALRDDKNDADLDLLFASFCRD